MATDGTMFFGSPNYGIPFSAVQFGTIKNLIFITDYNWDSQGYYRVTSWISKPTQEGISIVKSFKKAYKEYQRAESKSKSSSNSEKNDKQYVMLHRNIPHNYQEVFSQVFRLSDGAENRFANLQRIATNQQQLGELPGFLFHPSKHGELIRTTKSMFRIQSDAMRGFSYEAILSGLYLIKSIRGHQPLNWCSPTPQKNRLYNPQMINRMATHVK